MPLGPLGASRCQCHCLRSRATATGLPPASGSCFECRYCPVMLRPTTTTTFTTAIVIMMGTARQAGKHRGHLRNPTSLPPLQPETAATASQHAGTTGSIPERTTTASAAGRGTKAADIRLPLNRPPPAGEDAAWLHRCRGDGERSTTASMPLPVAAAHSTWNHDGNVTAA